MSIYEIGGERGFYNLIPNNQTGGQRQSEVNPFLDYYRNLNELPN